MAFYDWQTLILWLLSPVQYRLKHLFALTWSAPNSLLRCLKHWWRWHLPLDRQLTHRPFDDWKLVARIAKMPASLHRKWADSKEFGNSALHHVLFLRTSRSVLLAAFSLCQPTPLTKRLWIVQRAGLTFSPRPTSNHRTTIKAAPLELPASKHTLPAVIPAPLVTSAKNVSHSLPKGVAIGKPHA